MTREELDALRADCLRKQNGKGRYLAPPMAVEDLLGLLDALDAAEATLEYVRQVAALHRLPLESPEADALRDEMDATWRAAGDRVLGGEWSAALNEAEQRGRVAGLREAEDLCDLLRDECKSEKESGNSVMAGIWLERYTAARGAYREAAVRISALARQKPRDAADDVTEALFARCREVAQLKRDLHTCMTEKRNLRVSAREAQVERARIVAWLRREHANPRPEPGYDFAADAIERGEHREGDGGE